MPNPKLLFRGKHLHLLSRGHWEYAHRPHATGIVGIVAITDSKKIILVEQYLPPLDKASSNSPPVSSATPGNSKRTPRRRRPPRVARRNRLHRRQHEAPHRRHPSAGICDELITLFLATGLVKTAAGGGDDSEDITVHEVPLQSAFRWLESQRKSGKLLDLKIHSALYFASM